MEEILLFATILAPIILALTELVKKTTEVNKRFIPLIAFAIGLLTGLLATNFGNLETVERLWAGGLAGLSATGLFELALDKKEDEIIEEDEEV